MKIIEKSGRVTISITINNLPEAKGEKQQVAQSFLELNLSNLLGLLAQIIETWMLILSHENTVQHMGRFVDSLMTSLFKLHRSMGGTYKIEQPQHSLSVFSDFVEKDLNLDGLGDPDE